MLASEAAAHSFPECVIREESGLLLDPPFWRRPHAVCEDGSHALAIVTKSGRKPYKCDPTLSPVPAKS